MRFYIYWLEHSCQRKHEFLEYLWLHSVRHALTTFYVYAALVVIRYFLFYKCCYLFQPQAEYLLFLFSYICNGLLKTNKSWSRRMRNIVDNFLSGMSHALVNIIINNILSAIIKGKKSFNLTKKIDFIVIYDIVKCLFGITKG